MGIDSKFKRGSSLVAARGSGKRHIEHIVRGGGDAIVTADGQVSMALCSQKQIWGIINVFKIRMTLILEDGP